MARKKKGSWIVRMRCVVEKDVVCDDCTEEEAQSNPFDFAVEETEVGQCDYEVVDVTPNE